MAAYAGVASLLNNIEQMMSHPLLSTCFDNKQIESLHVKADGLLQFMINYGGLMMSKEVEDLERGIACAAHAAEDVIESHIVDRIHAGSCEASTVDLQQIIQDMDAILKKVNEFQEKEGVMREDQPTHPRPLRESGESGMVGFDDEMLQLLNDLTNQQSSRHIISVVGMGGTGKTTLVQNVYQNLLIKQHFDMRAWATASQQYNALEILSQLLPSQGKSSGKTVDELGEELHKTLWGRRYLIILDDVWSVKAWDELRRFFPDNGDGSRVVVTTRFSNIARDFHSTSCLTMKPLDKYESWKLFCKKAFQQETCPYPELEKVGKVIAISCRGLPLSTVLIGGLLLKSPRSLKFWENVARNIRSNPNSKEKQESLDILSLSYNHLPPHLKPCFLYMGVFKEDSEIRVSKIIQLWVAEGFVRANKSHILEEVAEGYLKELIDRNVISVRKHRSNGKVGSCVIHDLMRDLCLKVGQQQEFFHVTKGRRRGTERRLICSFHPGLQQLGPSLARSVFARSGLIPPVNHKLLRVWDEGRLESPQELYGYVNLRCLSYIHQNWVPKAKLPSSVSLIWNLQSIIISRDVGSKLVVAPLEIWKMRQLRHVMFDQLYVPNPPDGSFVMDNLRRFTRAVNLRVSEEVCKIIPNIKKLHLVYDSKLHEYDYDSLIKCVSNLDCLHKLETLNMIFRGYVRPEEMHKMTLRFPISLNKLSLSGHVLRGEDLLVIGLLPQLEVLQLEFYFLTTDNRWSPVSEQFLRLKFLKISHCGLIAWNADSSHFPVLEKLHLVDLWKLEEVPLDMSEIATLKLIRVDRCSESAAIAAIKVKEEQLENQGDDSLQIQLRMYKSEVKSFKERLETEGLKINHIQLETWS